MKGAKKDGEFVEGLMSYYPLANKVAKRYSNATVLPSVLP
jgi:hypothetical protein